MCSKNEEWNTSMLISKYFSNEGEWKWKQNITRSCSVTYHEFEEQKRGITVYGYLTETELKAKLKKEIWNYKYSGGLNNYTHPFNELFSNAPSTWHSSNEKIMRKLKELADEENEAIFVKCFPKEKVVSNPPLVSIP